MAEKNADINAQPPFPFADEKAVALWVAWLMFDQFAAPTTPKGMAKPAEMVGLIQEVCRIRDRLLAPTS